MNEAIYHNLEWYQLLYNDITPVMGDEEVMLNNMTNELAKPSLSNENILFSSTENWWPTYLLSKDFNYNLNAVDGALEDVNFRRLLESSLFGVGNVNSIDEGVFIQLLSSAALTRAESEWIFRYNKRFLLNIAEQCSVLFPFDICGTVLYEALEELDIKIDKHALDFIQNIKEPVEAQLEEASEMSNLNEEHLGNVTVDSAFKWYLLILYPLIKWQTTHYQKISGFMRGEKLVEKEINFCEMLITSKLMFFAPKLHRRTLLFRGSSLYQERNPEYGEMIHRAIQAGELTTQAYMSSSRAWKTAMEFCTKNIQEENVMMVFDVPKGFPVFLFEGQFEQEVLLPPCVTWSVERIATVGINKTLSNGKTPIMHILLMKPKEVKSWGYIPPSNFEDELGLKFDVCMDIGKMVYLMAYDRMKSDKSDTIPEQLATPNDVWLAMSRDSNFMCKRSPVSLINTSKAVPPLTGEFIYELSYRVPFYDSRFLTTFPEVKHFNKTLVHPAASKWSNGPHGDISPDYINLLYLMLKHQLDYSSLYRFVNYRKTTDRFFIEIINTFVVWYNNMMQYIAQTQQGGGRKQVQRKYSKKKSKRRSTKRRKKNRR